MLKIKQYKNRQYYCYDMGVRITLADIFSFKEEYQVLCDRTGQDVTALVKAKAERAHGGQTIFPFVQHYRGE